MFSTSEILVEPLSLAVLAGDLLEREAPEAVSGLVENGVAPVELGIFATSSGKEAKFDGADPASLVNDPAGDPGTDARGVLAS